MIIGRDVSVFFQIALCFYSANIIFYGAVIGKDVQTKESSVIITRKRRYVAFPEGSSLSISVCSTIGLIGNPSFNIFSYGINWGIGVDLPNKTWILNHLNGFGNNKAETERIRKRRHRRELYQNLEMWINRLGSNGRECVLRTLCESSQLFAKKHYDMAMGILKTVFSFPKSKVLSGEHPDILVYEKAFQLGERMENCALLYKDCNFSLLHLILEKIN